MHFRATRLDGNMPFTKNFYHILILRGDNTTRGVTPIHTPCNLVQICKWTPTTSDISGERCTVQTSIVGGYWLYFSSKDISTVWDKYRTSTFGTLIKVTF